MSELIEYTDEFDVEDVQPGDTVLIPHKVLGRVDNGSDIIVEAVVDQYFCSYRAKLDPDKILAHKPKPSEWLVGDWFYHKLCGVCLIIDVKNRTSGAQFLYYFRANDRYINSISSDFCRPATKEEIEKARGE